jgi:hypothetical protein
MQGDRQALTFTHNGWMMFCPIKMTDPFSSAEPPIVAARWLVLEPLFWLAERVQGLVIGLCSMTMPNYEPQWYFKVTGERSAQRRGGEP